MTLQNAIEWMRVNKLPYWRLETRNRKVAESQEDDSKELDIEESISHLETMLELLGPGRYNLKARKKKQGNAGEMHFSFTAEQEAEPAHIAGPPVHQQDNSQLIELHKKISELEFQLQKKEIEHQMSALKLEMQQIKEGNGNGKWDFFGDAVGRVLVDYLQTGKAPSFIKQAPAVSSTGIGSTAGTTTTNDTAAMEESERIEKALERLHEIAGDKLANSLEALATYAEQNPSQFTGFMDMLIAQNK